MRIEELILDGFKSYPVRTTISGWDASFNAVTGLNGSGKSNILDALVFVLGITNLSIVRAANLQDLIYKRGQAGITKASVTVVFDNSDRAKSPVGFEGYKQVVVTRQVAMGGVSKYLLCGHRATQQTVQNLFQSVQLNINNPNFLIMQGKITKVLNMKPQEILGLIEEAAGTSMFEEKKDKAIKTMAKKEKKMEEIQELLREEITPKLDRLREEKRSYLAYQKAASEIERLTRLLVAYEHVEATQRLAKHAEATAAKQAKLREGKDDLKRMATERARMDKDLQDLVKAQSKKSSKNGVIASLEAEIKEIARELAKVSQQLSLSRASEAEESTRMEELRVSVKEVTGQHKRRKLQAEEAKARYSTNKEAFDKVSSELRQAEELLQNLATGVSSAGVESASAGYLGQLAAARAKLASVGAGADQAAKRVAHLTKELKAKEPRAAKAQSESKGLLSELADARKSRDSLQKEIDRLTVNSEDVDRLRDDKDEAERQVRTLLEQRNTVKSKLASLDFVYTAPPSFDRSKVKGLVATLISIDPSKYQYSTALEVCAGGKLYNVVVETDKAGSELLEKGKLQKRVTMIPLNQINAFRATSQQIGAAQRLAPGKVHLALDLVGYEEEVAEAMAYVFGRTLICPDSQSAKTVTFDASVRLKSVTVDGDVYDPSGTLSGGSKPNTSGVLVKVQELQDLERRLSDAKVVATDATAAWKRVAASSERLDKLSSQLDLATHRVRLLEEQAEESDAARLLNELDALRKEIATLSETVSCVSGNKKAVQAEIARIEKEMAEFNNNKDSKLKDLKNDVATKKAAVHKQATANKALQKELQTTTLEVEQAAVEIQVAEAELADAIKNQGKGSSQIKRLGETVAALSAQQADKEALHREETAKLRAHRRELEELEKAVQEKEKEISTLEVKQQEREHDLEKASAERKRLDQILTRLENAYEWIAAEKTAFGRQGSVYDFASENMANVRKSCAELEQKQEGMRKKINPKVLNMIDSVEKKERELLGMHKQVLRDKSKIEETIAKLDDYKRDALKETWTVVNAAFGEIFGELLSGNFCALQPPEGMDITQGLEVKVRLGQIWKASLTELSGGQRSLIALSLIMSLLQFKPAPMYILDEVDAALDLSHTQNIGHLFRTRFKGSQFIVVSLKEGLFSNANVLFRTRFRDGTSVVERTATRTTSELYAADKENASQRPPAAKKALETGARAASVTVA